ncbi:MAG TPA: DNA-3-methyladenine glycosylase [Steroidobacteraceae bacterium]|nr:DNA-3-methyladenine glycosylase [Steroidobacteraceae bacterium]
MPPLRRRSLPVATVPLARFLVGKKLVHDTGAGLLSGRIVETEAYPPGDPTGYFRNGLTTANAPLFAARGTAYVRLVYGTCFNLNLAAEAEGTGAGVLIRALEPLDGIERMRANRPGVRDRDLARGPGRLCVALGIGRALSGIDLTAGGALWIESMRGRPADIVVSTRIGLSRDQQRRLRFVERGSLYASVPP